MSEPRIPTVQELLEEAAVTATAPDVVDQLHALVINLSALVIEQREQTAALDRIADALQVSSRGGETARADDPAGPAKGGNPAGDEPQDVEDVPSHRSPVGSTSFRTGIRDVTTESVLDGTSTPTTPLARLRQIAEAAATAGGETYAGPWSWVDRPTETGLSREVLVGAESEMGHIADVVPWMPELGEHIATFDPATVLALLDAAILLDAAVQLGVIREGSGLHRDAVRVLASLREVAP